MKNGIWGKNVKVDAYTTHIHPSACLGDDVVVWSNVYVGENTTVGDGTVIQYVAFIEHDCHIGSHSRVGTNAVLRRKTVVGDHSVFGSLSACEGESWIGNHVLIQTQCHITLGIVIEDWSFLGPMATTCNDNIMLHGRRHVQKFVPNGPHVRFGSRIGSNATLLPGVDVGREALIGAGSLVSKDVPEFSVAYGVPAKVVGLVQDKWRLPESSYRLFRERVSEKDLTLLIGELTGEWRR